MEKTINCDDCKNDFEYTVPTKYPDKRKYCDVCSVKRKKEWNAGNQQKPTETEPVHTEVVTMGRDMGKSEVFEKSEYESEQYQIKSREVRCRALEGAIKWLGTEILPRQVIELAKEFEKYILTGE